MNNPGPVPSQTPAPRRIPVLFSPEGPYPPSDAARKPERKWQPWFVATLVIGGLLGLIFWLGRAPSLTKNAGIDPYANYLALTHLHVSRANNFAGHPLVYVEGTLENRGNRTVTSVNMQAFFANDMGDPPRMEQSPVALIRSRQPYVDTEPLSVDPLSPGKSQDFRLTFDNVSPTWNQKTPQLHVLHVETRP